ALRLRGYVVHPLALEAVLPRGAVPLVLNVHAQGKRPLLDVGQQRAAFGVGFDEARGHIVLASAARCSGLLRCARRFAMVVASTRRSLTFNCFLAAALSIASSAASVIASLARRLRLGKGVIAAP